VLVTKDGCEVLTRRGRQLRSSEVFPGSGGSAAVT
jgi:hypothetical protein